MRLFVIELDHKEPGATDAYMTLDQLEARMRENWEGVPTIRKLDQAVLATLKISHVGQVVTWREGWIFCAEDAQT